MKSKFGWMAATAIGAVLATGLCIGLMSESYRLTAQEAPKAAETKEEAPQPRAIEGILRASRVKELKSLATRYEGEIGLLEIAAQGSWMSVGDTVAVLRMADFERTRSNAEREYRTAELALIAAEVEFKNRQEESASRLARIEFDHAKAKFDYDYWNDVGLADEIKRAELNMQGHVDGIADQEEELLQLEALYAGNELASESQKIVLERSRRRLQRAKENYEIAKHGNAYHLKHSLPRTTWEREEAFKRADALLTRSKMDEEAAIGSKEAAAIRARMGLEAATKRLTELSVDSESDTLYAPFSGLMIHGPLKDNSGAGKELEPGEVLSKGQVVATMLDIETLEVSVWVPLWRLTEFKAAETLLAVASDHGVLATSSASIASVGGIVIDGRVALRILVDNSDKLFMHGQKVRIEIGK